MCRFLNTYITFSTNNMSYVSLANSYRDTRYFQLSILITSRSYGALDKRECIIRHDYVYMYIDSREFTIEELVHAW